MTESNEAVSVQMFPFQQTDIRFLRGTKEVVCEGVVHTATGTDLRVMRGSDKVVREGMVHTATGTDLRVMRGSDEVVREGMVHVLTDSEVFRIKQVTLFRQQEGSKACTHKSDI